MKPRVISFDCAQTLVEVDWVPHRVACDAAEAAGAKIDRQVAGEIYGRLLATRWPEFHQLNRLRNEGACAAFWHELTCDWLVRIGLEAGLASEVVRHADRIIYGPPSEVFTLYEDVAPCLDSLTAAGYELVVVSNWDNSLHRVLREFGLTDRFTHVLASMEEGWEKPDARLFQAMYGRTGVRPGEVVHIGDNPVDDVQGALATGAQAFLLDRSAKESRGNMLATLADLPGALGQ